jgi:hypothetical protein
MNFSESRSHRSNDLKNVSILQGNTANILPVEDEHRAIVPGYIVKSFFSLRTWSEIEAR